MSSVGRSVVTTVFDFSSQRGPVSAPVPPLPRVRKRPLSRGATRQRGSVCLVSGGMSGQGARLNVFPTRQNLQVMKVKLVGAKKGHSLLKKKADALTMRLRLLLRNILKAKEDMGAAFRDGNFALAEVKYAAGDIKPTVIESVGVAQKKVEIRVDNIAGVKVPVFKVRRPRAQLPAPSRRNVCT